MGSPSKRNRKNVTFYASSVELKKRREKIRKGRNKVLLKTYVDPRNPAATNLTAAEFINILEAQWLEENQVRKASGKCAKTLTGTEYLRQWKILENVDEELLKKVKIALVAKFHWNKFTCAFLILENDEVHVLGDNRYGLLALNKPGGGEIEEPCLCPALSNRGIVDISVGQRSAAALTLEGKILTWGMNTNGQLGNGKMEKRASGVTVVGGELGNLKVIKFLCRETRVICFTSCGRFFGWGYNEAGVLGRPAAEQYVLEPVEILMNVGSKITDFWMDSHATLFVLAENGKLYSRGCNTSGTAGNGSGVDEYEPVEVKFPEGFQLKQLSPGYCCCLALDQDGKVYGWGCNHRGVLGTELPIRNLEPTLINFREPVETIAGSPSLYQFVTVFNTFGNKIHIFGRVKEQHVAWQDFNFEDIDQVFAAYGLGMRKCWLAKEHHKVPSLQDVSPVDTPKCVAQCDPAINLELESIEVDHEASFSDQDTVMAATKDSTGGPDTPNGSDEPEEEMLEMLKDQSTLSQDVTAMELPEYAESEESIPDTEETEDIAESTTSMQVDVDEKPSAFNLLEPEVPMSTEFDRNVLFDISFAVNGHRIIANRYSMKRSLYLRLKLDIDWRHNNLQKPVIITDWNHHVFNAFVKYTHRGVLDVDKVHYFDLLRLALTFRLNKLRRAVLEKIMANLNEGNALDTYDLAVEVKSEELKIVTLNFIVPRFWKLVGRGPTDDVSLGLIGRIATDLARYGFKSCAHDELVQE